MDNFFTIGEDGYLIKWKLEDKLSQISEQNNLSNLNKRRILSDDEDQDMKMNQIKNKNKLIKSNNIVNIKKIIKIKKRI